MKKHNFCAGPCILPQEVFKQASDAVLNFNDSGLSILEISHRSDAFVAVLEEARNLAIELLGLEGKGYKALYLQGGASMQFLMIAQNFLHIKAGYYNTGRWAGNAIKEAKLFGEVVDLGSSADRNFNYIPEIKAIDETLDYVHCTSNNTIAGTQMFEFPKTKNPLFVDMSSDIYSRALDFSQFDLIYAGAQKNIGPAGATLVVLKESLLSKITKDLPSMMDYRLWVEKESMFNTAPVFSIYTALLNLRWLKAQGGIAEMEKRSVAKSSLLYKEIDRNSLFEAHVQDPACRSRMNIAFVLKQDDLKQKFEAICEAAGVSGIKGHRSVGGYRASLYNALPIESVEVLVDCMKKLEEIA